MAVIFVDGFDTYTATTDIPRRWQYQLRPEGTSLISGRYDGQAMRITGASAYYNVRTITATQTIAVGFAIKFAAWPTGLPVSFLHLMSVGDSNASNQVGLGISSGHCIEVFQGANFEDDGGTTLAVGETELSLDTWYYIEIKVYVHATEGTVDVYIDGVSEVSLDEQNTKPQTAASVDRIGLVNGASGDVAFDDSYFDDAEVHGPRRVETLRPTADTAQKDFTASTGSDNYAMVDETTGDGDTTYVESDTVGHKDLYAMADLSETPTTIDCVQVNITVRETTAGQYNARPIMDSGGTTYNGSIGGLGTTYADFMHRWAVNPNGSAAWSKSAVDALKAGPEVTV